MVVLISEWAKMKSHIESWPSLEVIYKVDNVGERARLRIKAGNLGFDKTYSSKEEEFDTIVRLLDEMDATVATGQKDNDVFFM